MHLVKKTRPARVCFLIDELATAGTESQLLALIRDVDRARVLPHLVLLRGDSVTSQALEPDSCPVLRLGVGSLKHPSTLKAAWAFMRFLWQHRIDIVQTYFPDSSYFGVPVSWLAGVAHRVRTRNNIGHWMTTLHRALGRALNTLTTATIANCNPAREDLLEAEKPPARSVIVLENGVDLERFLTLPLPDGPARTIGVVANLRRVKGLDVLIEAVARLNNPNLRLTIAGEGEERQALTRQAARCGLGDRLHLVGSVSDIPGFLAGLDIAVLPSRAEGMSNALLEYMAAGRPIIATSVGATPDLVEEGVHALLVPPDDPGVLAKALERLIENRSLAVTLATNARQRARDRYSRQAMIARFEEFYTRLISNTAGGVLCPTC